MKKGLVFCMLLVALAAMVFTGCKKSDDSNNNDNPLIIDDPTAITDAVADWLIAFMPDDVTRMPNSILVTYLKDTNVPQPSDVVELFIDGYSVPIPSFEGIPGLYFGSYDLAQGGNYQVVFKVNGIQKVSTSLMMVYNTTNFTSPQYYVINQATPLSWTLAGNNQHQYAGVSAYKDNYPAEPTTDDYFVELGVAARNYSIPANAVNDLGTGAEYNLGVTQVNYNISNRIALMSFYDTFAVYGGITRTLDPIEIYQKALALHKAVNK
jgi:hypothetical protein